MVSGQCVDRHRALPSSEKVPFHGRYSSRETITCYNVPAQNVFPLQGLLDSPGIYSGVPLHKLFPQLSALIHVEFPVIRNPDFPTT